MRVQAARGETPTAQQRIAVLLALFGGPSSTLRTIDGMLRNVAVTLADTVKAALQTL